MTFAAGVRARKKAAGILARGRASGVALARWHAPAGVQVADRTRGRAWRGGAPAVRDALASALCRFAAALSLRAFNRAAPRGAAPQRRACRTQGKERESGVHPGDVHEHLLSSWLHRPDCTAWADVGSGPVVSGRFGMAAVLSLSLPPRRRGRRSPAPAAVGGEDGQGALGASAVGSDSDRLADARRSNARGLPAPFWKAS